MYGYNFPPEQEKPHIPLESMVVFGGYLHGLAIQTFKNTGDYFFLVIVIMLTIESVLREWICGYLFSRKKAIGPFLGEGDLILEA